MGRVFNGVGLPDTGTQFLRDDGAWAVPPSAQGAVPSGVICMWGGLLSAIPSGWLLCDGLNGTPDLRGLFIKGSAAGADPGATGGALTHAHADHSYTPAGTISQPTFTGNAVAAASSQATPKLVTGNTSTGLSVVTTATGTVSRPTLTGTPATLTHNAVNHEPPYYSLAFIQKA